MRINLIKLTFFFLFSVVFAEISIAGGARIPAPEPKPVPTGFRGNEFINATAQNFDFSVSAGTVLRPQCLKDIGYELILLDPGHDDSAASTRSDAKIRGGNGSYVIQWPDVHEGKLNMLTSYLIYELIVGAPELSASERAELKSMIRFTRMPGEKTFGEYELSGGYGASSGAITDGVENRVNRINNAIKTHRPYDAKTQSSSRNSTVNLSQKSLLVSIHANSSDYYDEGDLIWAIPPKQGSSEIQNLLNSFRFALSQQMGEFFQASNSDSASNAKLRLGASGSARADRVRIDPHTVNLAVLGSNVLTSKKLLIEGFVMNGMAGHLAHNEITQSPKIKSVEFVRNSKKVGTYNFSALYLAYAKSVVQALHERSGCK